MMTCIVAMLAFHQHHMFNGFKHLVVPAFGLVANLMCMAFYLVGPFFVPGMSPKEPYIALVVVGLWGVYGFVYFTRASGAKGKAVLLPETRRA
jgi:basic amino acid/polyamine antiporter, APA family